MKPKLITTVDAYIDQFNGELKARLISMRQLILANAPEVAESISYGMPAYSLNQKPLVYFAGYAKHIGFYATPTGHEKFKKELADYKQGKGSVQFPLNQPLPKILIISMVKFRVAENNGVLGSTY